MKSQINDIDKDGLIKDLAEGISKYYFQKFGEIDPEVIALENGITFSYSNYGDEFDGMIEFASQKCHIYINTHGNKNLKRNRFTFCHELGHYFISSHSYALINGEVPYLSSFTGFKTENQIEREADLFAANLLMPEEKVLRIRRKRRAFEYSIVQDIMNEFNVSELAALYRVFFLDLHPMLIVKSKNGNIIGPIVRSKDFYLKLNCSHKVPEDSLANDIFTKKVTVAKTKELWMLDWFDVNGESRVYEHCIYYPSIGMTYSIIWAK